LGKRGDNQFSKCIYAQGGVVPVFEKPVQAEEIIKGVQALYLARSSGKFFPASGSTKTFGIDVEKKARGFRSVAKWVGLMVQPPFFGGGSHE